MSHQEFNDKAWDSLLLEVLSGKATLQSKTLLLEKLSTDNKFREEFCDWLRMFREPGLLSYSAQNQKENI